MMPHDWKVKEYDGGHVGWFSVYECAVCGATAGGMPELKQAPRGAFFANGSGLQLSDDCAVSKQLIEAFERGVAWGRRDAPKTAMEQIRQWREWLGKHP